MSSPLDTVERILDQNPDKQPEPDEMAELIAALKQWGDDNADEDEAPANG